MRRNENKDCKQIREREVCVSCQLIFFHLSIVDSIEPHTQNIRNSSRGSREETVLHSRDSSLCTVRVVRVRLTCKQ